ncbi:hypothetical protein [uncultured Brevundimonas sp.]|uniref:hypothetical protein n=1 Tax=uncultured Brevundimonas sp. TaxID=213418 RepID=UPI0030EB7E53
MRKSERVFSHAERQAAVWILVLAALVTVAGLMVEQSWRRPSLGPDGIDAYVFAAPPGVLDARPVMASPGSLNVGT